MKTRSKGTLFWTTTSLFLAAAGLAADDGLVRRESIGNAPDGSQVDLYTLTNANGLKATVMTYGATLTGIWTPDRNGDLRNITLHLDTLDDYLKGHPLFGSVVGRYANRIANATFTLDGTEFSLTANAGIHHIHGGRETFQKLNWQAETIREDGVSGVRLRHISPDGHEGFPGELTAEVIYRLDDKNQLTLHYAATTTKPTVVNLTNHAYFNLAGAGSGDVLDQTLQIQADYYLPSDAAKIPTGEFRPVAKTVMDFRQPTAIGARIEQEEQQNYDHCYVLQKQPGQRLSFAARAVDPQSGRVMEVFTTKPGVQLYTAKHLSNKFKADGLDYGPYHGFCLETQHFPDAPNRPTFPSPVLRPGERYDHTTVFRFSVQP